MAKKETHEDTQLTDSQVEAIENLGSNVHVKTDEERKAEQDQQVSPNIDDPADGNKRYEDLNRTDDGGHAPGFKPETPATGQSAVNKLGNDAQDDSVVRAQSDKFDDNGKPVK